MLKLPKIRVNGGVKMGWLRDLFKKKEEKEQKAEKKAKDAKCGCDDKKK